MTSRANIQEAYNVTDRPLVDFLCTPGMGHYTPSDEYPNGKTLRPHTCLHDLKIYVSIFSPTPDLISPRTFCGIVWYLLRMMIPNEPAKLAAQPLTMIPYSCLDAKSLTFCLKVIDSHRACSRACTASSSCLPVSDHCACSNF